MGVLGFAVIVFGIGGAFVSCADFEEQQGKKKKKDKEESSEEISEVSEEQTADEPAEIAGAFLYCDWGQKIDANTVQVGCWTRTPPKEPMIKDADPSDAEPAAGADPAAAASLNLLEKGDWILVDAASNQIPSKINEIDGGNVDPGSIGGDADPAIEVTIEVPVDMLLTAQIKHKNVQEPLDSLLCGLKNPEVVKCINDGDGTDCVAPFLKASLKDLLVDKRSTCGGDSLKSFFMDGTARRGGGFLGGAIDGAATLILGGVPKFLGNKEFAADALCKSDIGISKTGFSGIDVTKKRVKIDQFDPKGEDGFCFIPFGDVVPLTSQKKDTMLWDDILFGGPPAKENQPACFFVLARGDFGTTGFLSPEPIKEAIMIIENPAVLDRKNVEGLTPDNLVSTFEAHKCETDKEEDD